MPRILATCTLLFLIVLSGLSQTTKRVPQDYATIQAAINAAVNGDTVLVAEGTYYENILYLGKKIVIASLYVNDNDTSHISATIINGSTPRHSDSAAVVTFDVGTDTNSVLCGFTITGGKGNRRYDPAQLITFTLGAGVDLYGSGGKIIHNHIVDNTSQTSSYGGSAGINAWDVSSTNENSKYLIIRNNLIARNHINGYYAEGGALGIGMSGEISGNRIIDNSAIGSFDAYGGGISIWGNSVITMVNNIIARNRSSFQSGAMVVYAAYGRVPDVTLVNNTVCYNSADFGCEGIAGGVSLRMLNNIVWNPGDGPEIVGMGTAGCRYNIIRGGYYDSPNYDENPLFADTLEFHLVSSSPAISRGVVSSVLRDTTVAAPSTDINGKLRSMVSGSNPDCGAVESDASEQVALSGQQQHISRTILSRNVRVYLPKSYASHHSIYPVFIFLHGSGGSGTNAALYGFNELAEEKQFIIVSPKSLYTGWEDQLEAGFIDGLIDILTSDYRIDTNCVFVGGYSSGAFMSYRYGLSTKKRIRGIASVAGLLQSNDNGMRPAGDIALAVFHSTGDAVVRYTGRTDYLNVEQSISKWMSYFQWENAFDTLQLADPYPSNGNSVQKIESRNTLVVFYKISGGSHAWPGPYATGHRPTIPDVNASAAIMDFFSGLLVGVERPDPQMQIPNTPSLSQNYPNPFNPETVIRYQLSVVSDVNLRVFDLLGREVAVLVNEEKTAGSYTVTWDASGLPSGIYFCRLTAGGMSQTRKAVLLR